MTAIPAGRRIASRIRQATFDPFGIETCMYSGSVVHSLYGRQIDPAGWSQLSWIHVPGLSTESDFCTVYPITGPASIFGVEGSLDYINAIAVEAVFPQLTLVNTRLPTPFKYDYATVQPDPLSTAYAQLYFYLSDGTAGLPAGTVYVGSNAALVALGAPATLILPFISYAPRHRAAWSDYALIAAIDNLTLGIDGAACEELNRHAIFNALQYRMRQDVYPVAVEEATSFPAQFVQAGVGTAVPSKLGSNNTSDRYKAFVAPFSLSASAFADKGTDRGHNSAFPALLACNNTIAVGISTICDIRDILVLEEEVLPNYGESPILFVATPAELGVGSGVTSPVNTLYVNNGQVQYSLAPSSFVVQGAVYLTSGNFTVNVVGGQSITYSPLKPFLVQNLGALYLEQTSDYLALTRPVIDAYRNPFSLPVDYSTWIVEESPCLETSVKVIGSMVTDWELVATKLDERNRRILYERYNYKCNDASYAGTNVTIRTDPIRGQFKYAYAYAQNEISRLQGQQFNYTNNSQYQVVLDPLTQRLKYAFFGNSAICRVTDRLYGYLDDDYQANFYRYVDNPLFAQRMPALPGSLIVSRRDNWINAIQPDASCSGAFESNNICFNLSTPALLSVQNSPFYGTPNSFLFNLGLIGVYWDVFVVSSE